MVAAVRPWPRATRVNNVIDVNDVSHFLSGDIRRFVNVTLHSDSEVEKLDENIPLSHELGSE